MKGRQHHITIPSPAHLHIKPFVSEWKITPAQQHFLKRFERIRFQESKNHHKARQARLELSESMKQEAMWGTTQEKAIRERIYNYTVSARHLKYLIRNGYSEWELMVKLGMWAHALDNHRTMQMRTKRFVPRDEVLHVLQEAGTKGATHNELKKITPFWSACFSYLRENGFKIEAIGGASDSRYVLKSQPKKHKLVTQREAYLRIARSIEMLLKPPPMREAWRYACWMAAMLREPTTKQLSANERLKKAYEDDLLNTAGKHLKRVTYLMAVAEQTALGLTRETDETGIDERATRLFQRLHKRKHRRL